MAFDSTEPCLGNEQRSRPPAHDHGGIAPPFDAAGPVVGPGKAALDEVGRRQTGAQQGVGHDALDVRDVGLAGADDAQIAAYAKEHKPALVTRDFDFSDVRNHPPAEYAGIIVLELPDDAITATVVKVLASFLSQPELLAQVSGRLAIVESWRVRFRPAFS